VPELSERQEEEVLALLVRQEEEVLALLVRQEEEEPQVQVEE